jgi:uncharacterized membrane protein
MTQNQSQNLNHSFSTWFNKNYMWIIIGLLSLFLFVAFLAPILMKIKLEKPARFIYWVYDAFCHQLAFRSWFLFGQQPFYPRELANIPNFVSFEKVTGYFQLDLNYAREFLGNELLGYKIALCQRDVAIYTSLLLSGLVYQLSGKKIKPIPWYFWIILGLLPIGVDGITQFGGLGISFLSWLPVRESTPLLRSITGLLFGVTTGLFMFPLIEENMRQSNEK